ncbi:hypothetical protein BDN70DRAFT_996952 [Pholiota conissans]|uniref:Protein kinase domain-containing protein n=1 Tax=Pholiota conissans TaxID=109636 RepID=A0A9P5YRP1_9AGAR|nr:hypothetical protein BDN70DRAFT_996952 [Pholiota conissans]
MDLSLVRSITADLRVESFIGIRTTETDRVRGMSTAPNNGVFLRHCYSIISKHSLIGRGTCIASAEPVKDGADWKNKEIVAKFSYIPKTRTPKGVVQANIVKKAGDRKEDIWVLNRLPEVFHYESLVPTADDVQTLLSAYFTAKSSDVYEDRVLQVMVMTEQFPITELTTSETLISVVRDVFNCYRWLYETAGIVHQDIGLNNIMFRRNDGHIHGVLVDYDLVLDFQKRDFGLNSKNRTGTRPYMALDLLDTPPMAHQYRHDLESLFYILAVLATGYKNGPLKDWCDAEEEEDSTALYDTKFTFISEPWLLPIIKPFHKLQDILQTMGDMFRQGYHARGNAKLAAVRALRRSQPIPEFDEATLGGYVDFDGFGEVLSLPLE